MDYKSLVALCLKLTGVLVLAFALNDLPNLIQMVITFNQTMPESNHLNVWYAILLFVLVIRLFIGVMLIYFSQTLAGKLLKVDMEASFTEGTWLKSFEAMVFRCMGIYYIVTGLSDVAFVYWRYHSFGGSGVYVYDYSIAYELAPSIVYLILGFALMLGSKGLVKILHKLRS